MSRPRGEVSREELETCLQEALPGASIRIVGREQLKTDVHRLRVAVDDRERSLVVKRSDSPVARRGWLVARRWLPAVGLEQLGPPLLALAPDSAGRGTWQVFDDLGGRPLSTDPPVDSDVEAAIDTIARIHTAFAEHRLLPQCRLWGGDRGIHFYSANLRAAANGLRGLDLNGHDDAAAGARDALLDRLAELLEEEPERSRVMRAHGAPETLLHGDLWPTNAIAVPNGSGVNVRLVDWDEAAAGPPWFDISTFLLRFDPSHRDWILSAYGRAIGRLAGWRVPPRPELDVIMETAAYARLASLLVWSVAAAGESEAAWLYERLAAVSEWIDEVRPVLP
jgi:hypothetical protein